MCGPPLADCSVADVLFLLDTTASMDAEIREIRRRLRDTIVPGLASVITDVQFAVAQFQDFPAPYGFPADRPFQLIQAATPSVMSTQRALDSLILGAGGDIAESATEALFQVATGAGHSTLVWARSCPPGTVGYPCFRPGATPIILLFTDAPFHNGPGGTWPYTMVSPPPATYATTVAQLNAMGAKVLGMMSETPAQRDLVQIARDTGAVTHDGSPLVFDIGADGTSLGVDVVRAVQTLCL